MTEQVAPDEILAGPYKREGAVANVQRLSGLQLSAMILISATGILIALIVLGTLIWAVATAPHPPQLPLAATDSALRADLIASYDTLAKAHWALITAVLEPLIWSGLLPLFTLLLGYLFGAQFEKKSSV